jgi:lipopolysaccharide export system protein LptA
MKVSFKMNLVFVFKYFGFLKVTLFFLIIVTISAGSIAAPKKTPVKKAPSLVLESANSNENSFENDEFISILRGNVVFTYDDMKIKSDEATWWRNQGKIIFVNHVKVFRGAQTVTCDQMHFTKNTNMLIANGNFHFVDTLEKTQLTGKDAEYHIQSKYFQLTGKPELTRFDTSTAETLFISAEKMWYIDSLKCANVTDNVKIIKGKLLSKCQNARYYTQTSFAQLRTNPDVTYQINHVKGDSIDLQFGKKSLKSANVMGHAYGTYIDTSAIKKDSSFTFIWGDSLLMSVSDSGKLDSLWVYGKAKSKYYISDQPENVNEASGKRMLISFANNGDADFVKVWGNARSRYFITEEKSKGINESSGDSITVVFNRGKASRLTLAGSARGIYFPRDL